ncbi:MAG: hypothetical protein J2P19_07985 [Pseudonocardia sp.]|nr:hypothetical protein [Pseudonocardia sp.]
MTNSPTSVLALPLAEQLLYELCLFGRMGANPSKRRILESYRLERVSVTLKFIRFLERARGLKFRADSRFAYCRIPTSDTSTEHLFGYTGAPGGPLPSEVAVSLLEFWRVQTELDYAPHPAMAAVLAQLDRHGYEYAFDYLYDLNESGYLSLKSLHLLARLLVQGRALTRTDHELVASLAGSRARLTSTDLEWLTQPLEVSWLIGKKTSAAAFPDQLIRRSWDEVEKLRQCANIDDWAGQLFATAAALTSLGGLLDAGAATAGLAVNAARAQLAEIAADLGGPWINQRDGIGLLTVAGTVALGGLSSLEQAGDEWLDRAYAERAVVPREVFEGIMRSAKWQSDEWFQLSWRTIVPWMAHFRAGETVMTRRGSYDGIGADSVYKDAQPESLTTAMAPVIDLFAQERYAEAIKLLQPLKKTFPYAGPLYGLLAIVLDSSGAHQAALEAMIPAVVLEPTSSDLWTTSARVAYTNGCEPDAMVLEAFGTLLHHENAN